MTTSNHAMGVASDSLLRITTGMSRPSSYSSRELRREAEHDATQSAIEGCLEKGWRVVIVDTVIKTGTSSLQAHDILNNYGCHVDGIIIVVDLSGGDNACTRAGIEIETLITL